MRDFPASHVWLPEGIGGYWFCNCIYTYRFSASRKYHWRVDQTNIIKHLGGVQNHWFILWDFLTAILCSTDGTTPQQQYFHVWWSIFLRVTVFHCSLFSARGTRRWYRRWIYLVVQRNFHCHVLQCEFSGGTGGSRGTALQRSVIDSGCGGVSCAFRRRSMIRQNQSQWYCGLNMI